MNSLERDMIKLFAWIDAYMIIEFPKRADVCSAADNEDSPNSTVQKSLPTAGRKSGRKGGASAKKRKQDLKAQRQRTEQLKYLRGYEDQILRIAIALNAIPSGSEAEPGEKISEEKSQDYKLPARTVCAEIAAIEPALLSSPDMVSLIDASLNTVEIINIFQDISNRINLFALKSTLEAARHKDIDGSFVQMAIELKDLATQTSQASERLHGYMSNIQNILASTTHNLAEQPAKSVSTPVPAKGLSWKKISERIAENIQEDTPELAASCEPAPELLTELLSESLTVVLPVQILEPGTHPLEEDDMLAHHSVPSSISCLVLEKLANSIKTRSDFEALTEQLTQSLNTMRLRPKQPI